MNALKGMSLRADVLTQDGIARLVLQVYHGTQISLALFMVLLLSRNPTTP
jgi:hypothetical protein